ncbi:MAG TPA: alpha-L-rhamnosidase C-terminal domain-containing protein [Terracidiphilus sp.]|nr:alpha-L-rhamnosidase C-terminal domain-containing protein [Terracidiphilus sp.]
MRRLSALATLLLCPLLLPAQLTPDPPQRTWHAAWVTHPTAPLREPIVLHFRRSLDLPSVPAAYPVRVSADNRFILFVNGQRVGDGPARGDLTHWRYELFDLAPYLRSGHNFITATIWNFGVYAAVSQMTDRTAFLLESEATGPTSISTPGGWQVEVEPGQRPLDRTSVNLLTYFASGPGEELDARHFDWSWDDASASGSSWVPVASPMRDSIFPVNEAHSAEATGDNPWGLIPDRLPHMEYSATPAGEPVRTNLPELRGFPGAAITIPAHTELHLLLDRKTLTTAYPSLTVSGGKAARILITYAEALFDKDHHKGDRDEVADRSALGLRDSFLPDGGAHRTFTPLWWRTWRYLDLDIVTAAEPLTLDALTAQFTAYPFQQRATWSATSPNADAALASDLDKIWEISWRTARLDAHETYMDTPYYEQLQYIGDTRIQALISYAVTGDDRLARQALDAFNASRIPEGLTRSRYPSALPQTIPTFSLLWIGMLHDWWMYRTDPAPIHEALPGVRSVLGWFQQYEQPNGLLHEVPWWSFIDWVQDKEVTPTYSQNGESCMTTLEYLGALDDASDLEKAYGDAVASDRDHTRAMHVRSGLHEKCWNAGRGLIADNPDQKIFSQQANILSVLYDVIPKQEQQQVLKKVLAIEPGTSPDGVMSASYYFRFYLARALDHAGMADAYVDSLAPWRKILPLHFSTWPETPGETRSDSHAWSAHPIYDLLTLVAGIEPASPGFASVRIAPHLGSLPSLKASYPHAQGMIQVEYKRTGAGLDATVTLPGKLGGTFVYAGKTWPLKPGANTLHVP